MIPALGLPQDDCGLALAMDAALIPSAGGDVIAYQGLVGCPRAWRFADYTAGAAYLFRRPSAAGWGDGVRLAPDETLIPGDQRNGELFGLAVDLHGNDVAIGAPLDVSDGFERGAAYYFTGSAQRKKIVPHDLPVGAAFGQSVSIDPWFLAVGAFSEDVPIVNAGAAYVYGLWGPIDFIGGPCCLIADIDARLSLALPGNGDFFGLSVRVETPYILASVSGRDLPSAGGAGGVALSRLRAYPSSWSLLGLVEPSVDVGGGEGAGSGGVAMSGSMLFAGAPGDAIAPSGSTVPEVGSAFAWDIEILRPLFADGFESGDVSAWSAVGTI